MGTFEMVTTVLVPFLVLVFGCVAADAFCHRVKIGEVH